MSAGTKTPAPGERSSQGRMVMDRELLEWAAKAAEMQLDGVDDLLGGLYLSDHMTVWSPLTNDADAFRLAVKLGLTIVPNYHVSQESIGVIEFTYLEDGSDYCAATRRAIVCAAASIGKATASAGEGA